MTIPSLRQAHDVDVIAGRRESREWTLEMVGVSARRRGPSPVDHLLGIFDVIDDVINRADRPARDFVVRLGGVSAERASTDEDRALAAGFTTLVAALAFEAGIAEMDDFLSAWSLLMTGTVGRAMGGDLDAAQRARQLAVDLIDRHLSTRIVIEPVAMQSVGDIDFDAHFDESYWNHA